MLSLQFFTSLLWMKKTESNIFRQSIHCFDGFFWLLLGTHMKNTRENPSQRIAEKCSWAPVAEQMDLLIWMGIKPIDGLMIPPVNIQKAIENGNL